VATGEFDVISRIAAMLPAAPPDEVWIGDDAAIVGGTAGPLLLAADVVVEGVHFKWNSRREDVGWKALAVNVSDIAAMGGRPRHALVTVAGPVHVDFDALYRGLAEAAAAYGCAIVGGDLANAELLVVSVSITGVLDPPDPPPVLRSGARPGDAIFVTGPLGAAAASGYALRPQARVSEGVAARVAGATAMIDISDGLAADLGHILDASGVGAVLDDVPVAEGATLEQAMGGGEDFELLFTAPADLDPSVGIRIGTCTSDPGQRPEAQGWQHRFSS
jgi:thiamine-monophosphate kinase